jgi:hypothetical protein
MGTAIPVSFSGMVNAAMRSFVSLSNGVLFVWPSTCQHRA